MFTIDELQAKLAGGATAVSLAEESLAKIESTKNLNAYISVLNERALQKAAESDKRRAEVGERVTLQFGSAFAGTQIYYMLRVGEDDRVFRRVDCRDDAIHTEYIDVDSSMLGGFMVELFTVREGIVEQWN